MKIPKYITDLVLRNTEEQRLKVEAASRDNRTGSISQQITVDSETLQVQTMAKYKAALAMATDPEQPDRSALIDLWRSLMLDNHMMSTIDSRILASQRSPFKIVNEKGEENPELTWLFERPWHAEMIHKVLFAQWQGTTLVETFELDENGELETVTEIPQTNFDPLKGIILKQQGDTKGWPYKEGAFANYYIQLGKDRDLGLFRYLAPIVLAKKLGLGAWLDYVEKFGVPPLFINTDREDAGRLRQLFDMGMNFRRNGFVVTRGNETVTVGNVNGSEGSGNFNSLIDRANSEISKLILGGTGMTDEKAYVGSAEIQYQLAKDRFEADKLLYKHFFNAKLKPKLIALSKVYAPLQNHYFDWDNTESLSKKDLADLFNTLGNNYEIDTEYITEQLGIPILGQKSGGFNSFSPEQEQKKKP